MAISKYFDETIYLVNLLFIDFVHYLLNFIKFYFY